MKTTVHIEAQTPEEASILGTQCSKIGEIFSKFLPLDTVHTVQLGCGTYTGRLVQILWDDAIIPAGAARPAVTSATLELESTAVAIIESTVERGIYYDC